MADITNSARVQSRRPSPAAAGSTRRPGSRPIEMRTVHRALSLIAFLFMLYVGVTGTWIQLIDMKTLLSGAPETDAVMTSINEGKFGNNYYSAVTLGDWGGAALPATLDVNKGFTTTLAAFHQAVPGQAPSFVELRVVDGKVLGQVAYTDPDAPKGKRGPPPPLAVKAFDAATGAPAEATDVRVAKPKHSLRQTLKQWHRFWGPDFFSHRDVPGVYIEFAVGLVMWVMILTGLIVYFRLLKQRRRIGRGQLFWMAGEKWRSLHRVVSVASAVLLVLVATSGMWIGFESSYATFAARGPREKPSRMTDEQVTRIAAATFRTFRADEPTTPIKAIRARLTSGFEEGAIVTGGGVTRQRVFAADSGREMPLSDKAYPKNNFPFGLDVHEWVKHFHSGYLFGLPARFLDLLAGLSLVFLSGSGIWMYVEMYGKRRRAGRNALFWK